MGPCDVRRGKPGSGPGLDLQADPAEATDRGGAGRVRRIGVLPLSVAARAAAPELLKDKARAGGGGLLCHEGPEAIASAGMKISEKRQ